MAEQLVLPLTRNLTKEEEARKRARIHALVESAMIKINRGQYNHELAKRGLKKEGTPVVN